MKKEKEQGESEKRYRKELEGGSTGAAATSGAPPSNADCRAEERSPLFPSRSSPLRLFRISRVGSLWCRVPSTGCFYTSQLSQPDGLLSEIQVGRSRQPPILLGVVRSKSSLADKGRSP